MRQSAESWQRKNVGPDDDDDDDDDETEGYPIENKTAEQVSTTPKGAYNLRAYNLGAYLQYEHTVLAVGLPCWSLKNYIYGCWFGDQNPFCGPTLWGHTIWGMQSGGLLLGAYNNSIYGF